MSTATAPQKTERSELSVCREYANFPEVSGATLPLLATVLAGFAVTIVV
ncbi:hypothetical protein BH23CHL5_BH23CHL5_13220 [soil metagenome]